MRIGKSSWNAVVGLMTLCSGLVGPAWAEETLDQSEPSDQSANVQEASTAQPALSDEAKESNEQFKGLNFGIGLGWSVDFKHNRVQRAEIIADTVRVLDQKTSLARVFLESHYFFVDDTGKRTWGHGPYVAIVTGGEDLIDAIGAGWMLGYRRARLTKPIDGAAAETVETQSFNIALGVLVDNKAQVLRDGIGENAPAPGAQSILKDTSKWAFMTMFSFSF